MKIDTTALADAFATNAAGTKKSGSSDFGALLKTAQSKQSASAAELEKYVQMTPAQRMTQAMMKKLGITQEEFDAMSPDQQASVTAKIAEMIKQEMSQQAAGNQAASGATLF
jgi:hypothetical protein